MRICCKTTINFISRQSFSLQLKICSAVHWNLAAFWHRERHDVFWCSFLRPTFKDGSSLRTMQRLEDTLEWKTMINTLLMSKEYAGNPLGRRWLEDHQFKTFCPLSWHSRGYLAPRSQLLFSISLCIQKTICLGTHKWKSFVWTSFKTTVLELQYLTLGLIWWENISSSLIMRNREFDGNQIAARCNGWIGSLEFGLSGFRSCSSV